MKTLIVYDSYFGNTEKVARSVGAALGGEPGVRVIRADEATAESVAGVGLLVVGSPTRGFRPTKGVKRFVSRLRARALDGVRIAAFDTRMSKEYVHSRILWFLVGIFGYAAEPIERWLVKKGGRRAVEPAGFVVVGAEGPLADGELERAAAWARAAGSRE